MKYRESVIQNVNTHVKPDDYLLMGALGLCGESGEVADIIKKHYFQGKPLDKEHLIKELGDVRWYMEVLCHALGTNIEEIEKINQQKLAARYPNGFSVDKSNNRSES